MSVGSISVLSRDLDPLQRPPQNRVRAPVALNPGASKRSDLDALQAALNSGDLATAQRAFLKLQENNKDAVAAAARQGTQTAGQPTGSEDGSPPAAEGNPPGQGSLDVYA